LVPKGSVYKKEKMGKKQFQRMKGRRRDAIGEPIKKN